MAVVPLLSPLSQFGLFCQPQTSFTRSKNRESFTTLRRVLLRIEARRIRWKIMLTTMLPPSEKSHRCVVETGWFYSKKSAIRIAATFFSWNTKLPATHDSRFFASRGKIEKGFSLDQETLVASMFFNERLRKVAKDAK